MVFRVGDYVEIEVWEGYYRGEYPSRIVRIFNDNLELVAPRLAGTLIPLKNDTFIVINVCQNESRYVFDSQVIASDEIGEGHITVTVPPNVEQKLRRSDVRLSIRVPVEMLYFYRNGFPVASYTVHSIDLSAGGIRIETPEELALHSKLKLGINLPDNNEELITTHADVVRTGTIKSKYTDLITTNTYWASLKFLNMSDNKKKKILKFIYKQQELRVKGLI